MRKMLEPKNTRPLRFCLRADRAFSGEDFSSLPLSTVRAAFTTALQHVARSLDMDAQACIMDHRVSLHVCKSQQSCFYLMEAVCSPAFAEAAIAHLRPCGGIIPMQLGRRTAAYAMRYEGENFAAAPFVLSFASAGGDLSMADEGAAAFCCDYLQQFHIEPIWAVAVDAAGAVRSFHGLASTEEAARFPATRSRPAVSTCYVLVPGTRRAYDLVAELYRSRNVATVAIDNRDQELHITRLLSRLPAAPPQATRHEPAAREGSLALFRHGGLLDPVEEEAGEEERTAEADDDERQGSALTSAAQRAAGTTNAELGAIAGGSEQRVAAAGSGEQQVAAAGGDEQQVAAAGGDEQQVAAAGSGEQRATAAGGDEQLAVAAGGDEQLEAPIVDAEGGSGDERMGCPSPGLSDEEIPDAADGGGNFTVVQSRKPRAGKQKAGQRDADPTPAKILKADGLCLKARPTRAKHAASPAAPREVGGASTSSA